MKQVIDLRPVYHRKEERIRAHVILCWLALLLARIAENAMRRDLARTAPPARPHRRRHLHRPRRDLPPAHRDQPSPGRHPRTARHRPAPEDLPAHPGRNRLTSGNTPPRYTPSIQEPAHSRTSNPRFADQRATQLRNPGQTRPFNLNSDPLDERWRNGSPPPPGPCQLCVRPLLLGAVGTTASWARIRSASGAPSSAYRVRASRQC